jgi:hypothetical protein
MIRSLNIIPLQLFAVAADCWVVFSFGAGALEHVLLSITLPTTGIVRITVSFVLVQLMMLFLLLELMKAAQTGWVSIANNTLSSLVFIAAFGLFLTVGAFGTATWLLLCSAMLIDGLCGFIIGQIAAKRDFGLGIG